MRVNHTNTFKAYLGLGANLGDRLENLRIALRELDDLPTIEVVRVSSLYETEPVGVTEQPDFLNLVAEVQTSLSPLDLLQAVLNLENKIGRVRTFRWGPRVIDIDLLLYEDRQMRLPELTLPHPRLRERAFVVVPLAEIAPELALPEDGKKIAALAEIFSTDILSCGGNIWGAGSV